MIRLMLADDEQYERDYLEKVIRKSYPTLLEVVCKAGDGVELMEKLEECNPQIILLDIKMPRMDGLRTAELIRERHPDVQIVIVSAYSDFNYAKQAMKIGIAEYLLKPYPDSELKGTLDRVIARIRRREDTLSMMSFTKREDAAQSSDLMKALEKDFLWNSVFKRETVHEEGELLGVRDAENGWVKVVLISCSALSSMGDFSQEVMKNFFCMEGIAVINSIWMDQMVICLYSDEQDLFTEVNSCIRRARDYLAEEHRIPVGCGVSGVYRGVESLPEAYQEAAAFICEFSGPEVGKEFTEIQDCMKKLCALEDEIAGGFVRGEREQNLARFEELVELLEAALAYEEMAVKINFTRSLLTIIHGVNRKQGFRVRTAEVAVQLEKLKQLSFNGDHLKYHLDHFADMKVESDQ